MLPNLIVEKGTEARKRLIDGAQFGGKGVEITIGPWGQNWFLEKDGGTVTNDGVKIIKEMRLKEEISNRGLVAIKQASMKTNDEVGDGTSTAALLGSEITDEAGQYFGDDETGRIGKKTSSEIIAQIETERLQVEAKLDALATPIETEEQLIASARVSVEDEKLGELIGKTQWKLGKDGVILAETTAERDCSVEIVNGVRIDNGFGTSAMMNNVERETLEVEESAIILTNYTFQNLGPLRKVFEKIIGEQIKRVIIVGRGFTEEAIKLCLQNVNNDHALATFPINAPYVNQAEIMEDMASVLGATFYNVETRSIDQINIADVGFCQKLVAGRYNAIFTGKSDDLTKERIAKRVDVLKEKLKGEKSDFMVRMLKTRIAQLENGFALLKVGANSEIERKRLYDKCEDAVNAVRVAFQEGTVEGAGLAFKKIADEMPNDSILKRPLGAVWRQIKGSAPKDWQPEDWVRDPVKVLKVALRNACSVAGSLASAGGVICTENPLPIDTLLKRNGASES